MTKRILERRINRAKIQLEELEKRQSHLSKHGYWDMGYLKGIITVLEDWLDELTEKEKEEE